MAGGFGHLVESSYRKMHMAVNDLFESPLLVKISIKVPASWFQRGTSAALFLVFPQIQQALEYLSVSKRTWCFRQQLHGCPGPEAHHFPS